MNIEKILKKIHKGTPLNEDELSYLETNCYEDEDIYEILKKGDLIYQIIFHIGDEYYAAYQIRNDMWGNEWDLQEGIQRVYPKEVKTIVWSTEEG